MKLSFQKNDIVLIDWIDSSFDRGWRTDKEVMNDNQQNGHAIDHRTVGFFFSVDKRVIVVAQSVSNNGPFWEKSSTERMAIPLCAIKKIKKLSSSASV